MTYRQLFPSEFPPEPQSPITHTKTSSKLKSILQPYTPKRNLHKSTVSLHNSMRESQQPNLFGSTTSAQGFGFSTATSRFTQGKMQTTTATGFGLSKTALSKSKSQSQEVKIPMSSFYKGVQVPADLFDMKAFPQCLDNTLKNNRTVQRTLQDFYKNTSRDRLNETQERLGDWERKMEVGDRQKKVNPFTDMMLGEGELMVAAPPASKFFNKPGPLTFGASKQSPAKDSILPKGSSDQKYSKRYLNPVSLANISHNTSHHLTETNQDTDNGRGKDILYKALWLRPASMTQNATGGWSQFWSNFPPLPPLPSNDNTKMVGSNGKAYILSKLSPISYLLWTINLLTGENSCGEIERGIEDERIDFHAVPYDDKIIIFGGQGSEIKYSANYIHRDILMVGMQPPHHVEKISACPMPGVNHGRKKAAVTVGSKWLFVHGGIDEEDRVTNTLMVFDLKDRKWIHPVVNFKTTQLELHSMALAVKSPIALSKATDFYNEIPKYKPGYGEGLYIFGGRDKTSRCCGTLFRIRMFCKPWLLDSLPPGSSYAPTARHSSSLTYFHKIHCLVLFGGVDSSNTPLNDLHLYSISVQQWAEVKLTSRYLPEPRGGFSSFPVHGGLGDKGRQGLIVLGGIGKENFVGGGLEVLEIDDNVYTKLIVDKSKGAPTTQEEQLLTTKGKIQEANRRKVNEKLKSMARHGHYLPIPMEGLLEKIQEQNAATPR
jgi:hypothetical protein